MYLLDSSAWLAHLFGEAGMNQVTTLFTEEVSVNICALSLPEVFIRLKALGQEERWPLVWEIYQTLFTEIIAVDSQVAQAAIQLRSATPHRLPTIDSLIAATAMVHGLTLVHRDPHLAAIPQMMVSQIMLPQK